MNIKVPRIWTKIALVVLVVIFQLLSTRISFIYNQNVRILEFGLKNGAITFLMEFLSLLSGFALALVPDRSPNENNNSKNVNNAFILLFIFSLLIVIVKILMYGFGLFHLWHSDFFFEIFTPFKTFGTWITTQIPSLFAGFSLRYLFRR